MAKQTKEELAEYLREQMDFLRSSSEAFDQGKESEAKRLAVVLRVLLYNTKSLIRYSSNSAFNTSPSSWIPSGDRHRQNLASSRVHGTRVWRLSSLALMERATRLLSEVWT